LDGQPASPTLLQVINVSKTIAQGATNGWAILRSISFSLAPGEFVVIYGASGSGKSTLLKLLAGLEWPTEGQIVFRGESLQAKSSDDIARYRLEDMGVVLSGSTLLPHLTVRENIALPDIVSGLPRKRRFDRANQLLTQMEIESYANYSPAQVPSAVRQKCLVARALVKNPAILLVNDPTRDLDTNSAKEIMELLADLNRSVGTAIIMMSIVPEHVYYPHRVIYLKDGTIAKEVINRPVLWRQIVDSYGAKVTQ
jgi:ABC-type lipoprotein export system ATPase subunit